MILEVLWVLSLALAVVLTLALLGSSVPGRGLVGAALAVALYGLGGASAVLARQLDVAGWLPVEARVVVSERGRTANDWRFAYEYEVEGQRYRGSRLGYQPRVRGRADTDRLAAAYPRGAAIVVYRDPDDASRSVVDKTPAWSLAAVGFGVHGALVVAWLRARRRTPASARGPDQGTA